MTQAVCRRLESIQLMTQAAFQEVTHNQLITQVDSPGIDSDWLTTQNASPFFRFKSTHGSSEKLLILNRLMIRLWVIPMCGCLHTSTMPYVLYTGSGISAPAHVQRKHPFKQIYSLPLVNRPKGVLLVLRVLGWSDQQSLDSNELCHFQ